MIATLGVKDTYPLIEFKVVRKAVEYYTWDLGKEDKQKIRQCLEIIKFSMGN